MNYEVTHRSLSPKPILSSIKMKNSSTTSLQLIRSSMHQCAQSVLAWRWEGLVSFRCSWVRVLMCTPVIPRWFICSLGLQGVQWAVGLIVVRASWPGHHVDQKKKKYASMHVTSCSSGGSKASWILTRTVFITSWNTHLKLRTVTNSPMKSCPHRSGMNHQTLV